MKTQSAALAAHYQGDETTLATLWKVTRRDGQVYGFTDHPEPITHDGVTYEPSSSYDASAVRTLAELNVDDLEVHGLLASDGITAEDIEAGLWDGAAVQILEVNYADLTMGENVMRVGELGEAQREGLTYKVELRGLMQKLQNNIGRVVTPACDADFGDARCGIDLEARRVPITVTAATDARTFEVIGLGADGYAYGVVTWTNGANAGLSMEVKRQVGAELTLQLPMPYAIQPDDEATIVPGCDKTKATCKDVYFNVVNFRGFSFVPGGDKVLKVGGQ